MPVRPLPFMFAAALFAAAGQPTALGALITWNNAAGGSAAVSTNWNPNQLPGAADDLTFNLAGAYAVSFGSTTSASRSMTFRRGTVTLTASSPHTVSTGITIGDLNTDVATATLTGGTLNSTASVVVGDAIGSNGTLNINDDDADLILTGPTADLTVGSNAPGALNITGGGRVVVSDQFIAGNNAPSTSNITVSGFLSLAPFTISRLEVQGTSSSRFGQGGNATVNILNGGLASFAGDLVIANGSASSATATVAGSGLLFGATLNVAGDLLLARNVSAGTDAGAAILNINADGRLIVGGTLFVAGDPDGGTATLHTEPNATVTTHSLAIGSGATLDFDGGVIDIDGGTFTWNIPNVSVALNGAPGNPVFTLRNGATASFGRVNLTGQVLTVGTGTGANIADFDVRSGSDLSLSDGISTLGAGPDDTGRMIVSGPGSTLTLDSAGSALIVGDAGAGYLEVENGATVTGDGLFIATDAGSSGVVLLEGAGTAAAFNNIYVGGTSSIAGGVGQAIVNVEAALNMPGPGGIIRVYPGCEFMNTGGLVNAASVDMLVEGDLRFQSTGGQTHIGTATISSGGRIVVHPSTPGSALLDGSVLLESGASLEMINGDLTVGTASRPTGFSAATGSTITLADNTLTILDADEAEIDVLTMAGGTLVAPNPDGILIRSGGTIDGEGTINGTVFFHSGGSVITATGTGITINGLLRNDSGNIDGARYTFNAGPGGQPGGWTGAGAINARAVFNSGAQVNALANMTVGFSAFDGLTFNPGSELHAGTRTVTLVDSNGLALPSITDLNGGRVVCTQNLTVAPGRRLSGRGGSIDTPLLTIQGTLAPGELNDQSFGETGELTVNGSVIFSPPAIADIEIQGLLALQHDNFLVNGPVTLNGALNISFISGFQPTAAFQLPILTATSITNAFTTVTLPPGTHLTTTPTQIILHFCPADFNSSGTLTVQDIFDFLAAYFSAGPSADFNHSGAITVQDIFDFLAAYFAGC